MGNKHNSSKKQNSKLLFQSPLSKTPEKSILSSNNKSDVLAKNSSYSFLNNSTQKIEMHSEINLAPFRESFKRKKKKEKPTDDDVFHEMSQSIDFITNFCLTKDLTNIKINLNSNTLLTCNLENLSVEKNHKPQTKLISFEDILINSSQKQISMKDERKFISDNYKLETEGLNIVNFGYKIDKNINEIDLMKIKIQKFNEKRVNSKKMLPSPDFWNSDTEKLSNSSHQSNKLISKIIEENKNNENENETSKISEESNGKKLEIQAYNKRINIGVDRAQLDNEKKNHFSTSNIEESTKKIILFHEDYHNENKKSDKKNVISLVKFIKKQESITSESNEITNEKKQNVDILLKKEREFSKETSQFNSIINNNEFLEEKKKVITPDFLSDIHKNNSIKASRKNSKESFQSNDSKGLKNSHEPSCLFNKLKEKLPSEHHSLKNETIEKSNNKLSKFFKEEITTAIEKVNLSLRNSQNNSFQQSKIINNLNESPNNSKILSESLQINLNPTMSQDIKVSQNRVLEIIFNEKLIKKRKDENYVLSPQKNKKILSHSATPKSKQLFIKNHYLNNEENSYFKIMNKIKDQNDISYNQLFDNPNKSKTNNNWNKTSDIHQKLNKSNFLKQSSNQQNHSYLSTPLILIQKPQKPVIIKKEKPIPRSNIIKDPKPELKFEIKSGATTPKSSNTPKNFKNIPKSSNIPKNLKSPIKKKISMKRIPKNNSKNETYDIIESNNLVICDQNIFKPNEKERVSMRNSDRFLIKNQKDYRESKKSIRISTTKKEGNDLNEEPTPKMSIRTRASSENNPEKMIRNVRVDIEQLKNKIKGRLAANLSIKFNNYH